MKRSRSVKKIRGICGTGEEKGRGPRGKSEWGKGRKSQDQNTKLHHHLRKPPSNTLERWKNAMPQKREEDQVRKKNRRRAETEKRTLPGEYQRKRPGVY